jgi:uncharacterized membrane protein
MISEAPGGIQGEFRGSARRNTGGPPFSGEVSMTDAHEGPGREYTLTFFTMVLTAALLAFPPSASAVEVGCFCTFVFVSAMFVTGIGLTLLIKYALSKKLWKLSLKRTFFITFLEVVLLVVILIILQTKYYFRVLAYLPLAFLLNYAMTTASGPAFPAQPAPRKRVTMAALSSLILPAAVQMMAWFATFLSNMITFTEVRV